jgi:cytochrome c551/c552
MGAMMLDSAVGILQVNLYHRLIARVMPILMLLLIKSLFSQNISIPESPWKGREVYNKKGCVQCHSIYGRGGEDGPDLGENKFYGTYLELAALMWNHFPEMYDKMQNTGYEFPHLIKKETMQLIAYLSYVRYMGESGDEEEGRELLKTKGCVSCHKFGGKEGDIGPDFSSKNEYLSPLFLVESIWNHIPDMVEIFEKYETERPEFEGDEIVDLTSGIQSYMQTNTIPVSSHDLGNPVKGKILSEKKGCMKCHAVGGKGGNLGPDFRDINLNYSVTQIAGKMWNHGPKMWEIMKKEEISFPVFEKGEMADVIAYLYGLQLEDAPGDVEQGQKLIMDKKCLSCHSMQGKGGNISVDFASINELDAPLTMIGIMWNHSPAMQKRLVEKNLAWPELNGRDMANLYAYLQSISKPKGIQ